MDSIASKAEKNNKDEVKNENDINEAIKKILLIKNTIRDLKSWLIQNLEKILIENARNGKKLPFILIFEDHYSKYLNYWLFPHFNTLGLSHPDIYYMDRKEYYEIIQ